MDVVDLQEQIHSRCEIGHSVFYSHHIRDNDHLPAQQLEEGDKVREDYLHYLCRCYLHHLNSVGLKLIFDGPFVVFRLIIDPENNFVEVGPGHRDFLQLCSLHLALSVIAVEHEISKWQDQNLFFIGKL